MQSSESTWAELYDVSAHQLKKSHAILNRVSNKTSPEWQAAYDSHRQLIRTHVEIFGLNLELVH